MTAVAKVKDYESTNTRTTQRNRVYIRCKNPAEAVITLTPTKFTFELEGEPANAGNLRLIVQASAPQSNGISRAYSKASQIGEPLAAASEVYDLKASYDEKNGAPTTAAPKVFMKYFFVNTVTGEKSGEMLAVVSLDEDAGE